MTQRVQAKPVPVIDSMVRTRFNRFVSLSDCVFKGTHCWSWNGAINTGYGYFAIHGDRFLTHRVIASDRRPDIDLQPALVLDHLCRHRWCVNPLHLEQVEHAENVARGEGRSNLWDTQTHCVNGHEFNERNTHYRKSGGRTCRPCHSASQLRSVARLRN